MNITKEYCFMNTIEGAVGADLKQLSNGSYQIGTVTGCSLTPFFVDDVTNKPIASNFTEGTAGTAGQVLVDFGTPTSSVLYTWALTVPDAYGANRTIQGSYTTDSTGTEAEITTAFYNWAVAALPSTYTITDEGATGGRIIAPLNTVITLVNTCAYAMTITTVICTARVGYGADLIALGYPTASSSSANDGAVATASYDSYIFNISQTVPGTSESTTYSKQLFLNEAGTEITSLETRIESVFGA